jgi:hypothetical protein
VSYANASTADSWDNYQTTNTWMALDANRTVMWSNHYIPNGSLSATTMYFDAYEAIPEVEAYQIEKDTVVGIADQVRRLCKTEATMTPAQIESNLGGLNIELEELHIWATSVEQTFVPGEGIYGFSKVVLDAVDDSGGGDYPGGGGGGDYPSYDDIPNADDAYFGSEYVEEETPTGLYDYINTYGQHTVVPYAPSHPYIAILADVESGNQVQAATCYGASVPFEYNNFHYHAGGTAISVYEYDPVSGNTQWIPASAVEVFHRNPRWNNHDIRNTANGYPGSLSNGQDHDPVPYMEMTEVEKPLEYEDTYTISGGSVSDIVTLAQKITGTKEPMTVEQATAVLDEFYKQPKAEELTY